MGKPIEPYEPSAFDFVITNIYYHVNGKDQKVGRDQEKIYHEEIERLRLKLIVYDFSNSIPQERVIPAIFEKN